MINHPRRIQRLKQLESRIKSVRFAANNSTKTGSKSLLDRADTVLSVQKQWREMLEDGRRTIVRLRSNLFLLWRAFIDDNFLVFYWGGIYVYRKFWFGGLGTVDWQTFYRFGLPFVFLTFNCQWKCLGMWKVNHFENVNYIIHFYRFVIWTIKLEYTWLLFCYWWPSDSIW